MRQHEEGKGGHLRLRVEGTVVVLLRMVVVLPRLLVVGMVGEVGRKVGLLVA